MKYRQYVLMFKGDPEVISFLRKRVGEQWPALKQARTRGRAARLLFGVEYNVKSVVAPRPVVKRVKPL